MYFPRATMWSFCIVPLRVHKLDVTVALHRIQGELELVTRLPERCPL